MLTLVVAMQSLHPVVSGYTKSLLFFRMLLCNQNFTCEITRLFALPATPLADLLRYFLFPLPMRITQVVFLLPAALVVK